MKRIKYLIITILMVFCLMPNNVFAAGNISVSTASLNITKGVSSSFKITANNAAGRVDISSSNPSVASVSTSNLFLDMESGTVTVKGNSVGTATIKIYVTDATTYDDEDLTGKTYTVNVNVTEPIIRSNNNNLKTLTVDGYDLVKSDNNNYTLTVNNDVTSINVNAIADDEKAKVNGAGLHELNIGENNIEIVVTAESGAENKINIKVTRKEGYYLEDLESLLNGNNNNIDIIINSDSKLSKENLTKIKDSKKTINLNYYDGNKKLIYSWIINGKEIKDTNEMLTSISYISEYVKEISKLSNYADGLHISFKHNGSLPEGVKVKLYVGDKFDDGSLLNTYSYNKNKKTLEFIQDNLKVTEGYIEFDSENSSEYFVTMSDITNSNKSNSSKTIILVIISIIEFLAIISMLVIYILKIKKEVNNKNLNCSLNKNVDSEFIDVNE